MFEKSKSRARLSKCEYGLVLISNDHSLAVKSWIGPKNMPFVKYPTFITNRMKKISEYLISKGSPNIFCKIWDSSKSNIKFYNCTCI